MHQIKHHSRSVSQLLMAGLLSCCIFLIVGLLSYWLVVLRLLKYILKRKEQKEVPQEIEPVSTADTGESPALSPKVEPKQKAVDTKVEPEQKAVDTKVEPEQKAVDTKVEPKQKAVDTKVEPKQKAVDTKVEPEQKAVDTKVEPKQKAVDTKAEDSVIAMEAIEAYCVKCRQKRAIQGAKKVTTQKGRQAMEGTCPICGTKLFRFIAREKDTLSEEV